jgi:hypothetical protein
MNRVGSLLLLLALLAPLVWAQPPTPRPEELRVRQWQQNRVLIQTLVSSSLVLAEVPEKDHSKKAEHYYDVAGRMVEAVAESLASHDPPRTYELCYHLFDLLESGVADNLRQAHEAGVTPGSTLDRTLRTLQKRCIELVKPLESELQSYPTTGADADLLDQARQAVRAGRARVENALPRR